MRWARAVGVLVCFWVVAPLALAAGGGWSASPQQSAYGSQQFNAVSCSSPSACTVVGDVVERWDGRRWRAQSTPGTAGVFYGVSCPTVSDCVAVGSGLSPGPDKQYCSVSVALRWNGKKWTAQRTPSPGGPAQLNAVSCSSARACTAVGAYGSSRGGGSQQAFAERWNGIRWTVQRIPQPASQVDLFGVSCASASACTAVGGFGSDPIEPIYGQSHILAVHWNGRQWSVQHTLASARGGLTGVSCPTPKWCVAVGYGPGSRSAKLFTERWNGKSWAAQRTPPGDFGQSAVSCTSTRACTSVGGNPGRWNGSQWSVQHLSSGNAIHPSMLGVSCPSLNMCMAAGYDDTGATYDFSLIFRWTG